MDEVFLRLLDGTVMPKVGFGCFDLQMDRIEYIINDALSVGYRYFDNATRYENERQVGNAIKNSGIDRKSLYLVSKLWPNAFEIAERGVYYSLRELGVDYLDAYYLHWPSIDPDLRLRAWEVLLTLQQKGLIRSIGVSNFKAHHLEHLINAFGVKPVINQIQLHPWHQQKNLVDFCQAEGIAVSAWSPLYRGKTMDSPILASIGSNFNKTPAQITLMWHLAKGHIVLPKSSSPKRMAENLNIFDDQLSVDDITLIDALESGEFIGPDPDVNSGDNFSFRPS